MKMKDVEQLLEIPKATIRFYEKEGLIAPQRGSNTYREYTEQDIERLRKIVVLRKIGIPVSEIKKLFEENLSLQEALADNLTNLQNQLKEIEGAMKVCELMQKKEETMSSMNENYYWDVIHTEEATGHKFFDLLNDVVEFEKKVIFDEFGIADEEGKLKYKPGIAVLIAFGCCLMAGILWSGLDGWNKASFVEGFIFPMVCIIISSVFGLPVFFIEKKHPELAGKIKKLGSILCILAAIAIVLLIIFVPV